MSEQIATQVWDFEYKGFQYSVTRYSYSTTIPLPTILPSHWYCGYVIIPENHEFYDKHYDDINIDCHGGLTYSRKFHIEKSKNYNKFAIGFDFNHFDDYGGTKESAIIECKQVIDQLFTKEVKS